MFYQIRKDKISPCTLSSALNAEVGGEMVRLVMFFLLINGRLPCTMMRQNENSWPQNFSLFSSFRVEK